MQIALGTFDAFADRWEQAFRANGVTHTNRLDIFAPRAAAATSMPTWPFERAVHTAETDASLRPDHQVDVHPALHRPG